ncbi:MAG: HTH domain-containing protein [Candidatus Symbiothrix sp.]|nr:HTH domain-containing protein [Candidatus Symbiothrix sp.]
MTPFDIIKRLYDIHLCIKQENTGTPDEFAKKFHLSRRQLYNIIEELKDYGAVIEYSRIRQTFFYVNDFDITINQLHFSFSKEK